MTRIVERCWTEPARMAPIPSGKTQTVCQSARSNLRHAGLRREENRREMRPTTLASSSQTQTARMPDLGKRRLAMQDWALGPPPHPGPHFSGTPEQALKGSRCGQSGGEEAIPQIGQLHQALAPSNQRETDQQWQPATAPALPLARPSRGQASTRAAPPADRARHSSLAH